MEGRYDLKIDAMKELVAPWPLVHLKFHFTLRNTSDRLLYYYYSRY